MWGPRNDGKESECTECADKLKAEAGSCTGMRAVLDVCTPKGEEGVVGAVLFTSYQIGSTVGIAVAAAVTQGVNSHRPIDPIIQYKGYAASFWSLVAMHSFMAVVTILFVRD